jgi:uncharacterized protein Yka (UPF0111/DUF47 family)
MTIESLLDEIDEMIDKAWGLPLSGGKCLVEADKLRDIIDNIRGNMPSEIRQAKSIVADRTEIIETAKKEAEDIVRAAEERARTMVLQEEIVKLAQQKSNEITTQTQQKCREMRKGAQEFVDDLLKRTEEDLTKRVTEVHQTRQMLRKPAAREE